MQKVQHNLSHAQPMPKDQVVDFMNRSYSKKYVETESEMEFEEVVFDVINQRYKIKKKVK